MGFDSIRSFVFFICIVVLLFSIIRVCLSAWLQYKQNKRLFYISSYLSLQLYQNYYSRDVYKRQVFNSAVSENLVTPETNPFQKIHLRPVSTYKRSVGIQVIKDMTELDLKGKKRLDFARDLFLFSFMACGMAFVDLAHLTQNNVRGNVLVLSLINIYDKRTFP